MKSRLPWPHALSALILSIMVPAAALATPLEDPLLQAVRGGDEAQVESLLQQGANPDAASRQPPYAGKTALMWAGDLGYQEMVRSLLRHGAQVDARHPKGSTALMYAVLRHQPGTVELLLEAGADPNLRVRHGWNPVLLATVKGHAQNVDMLVRYGAHLRVGDLYGWTPLMRAAERGDLDLVKMLLELGCDPEQREHSGQTALDIARMLGHEEVASVLASGPGGKFGAYGAKPGAPEQGGQVQE